MKVLLDVNVIVDILGATEDVFYSVQALDVIILRGFQPCMVVSEAATVQYVLSARKYTSADRALAAIEGISELLTVLDATEADFRSALNEPLGDFEDAMLAWAARRHGVDLIVTRNLRDFRKSPVAAMTPQQFCDVYRPEGYDYDLVKLE